MNTGDVPTIAVTQNYAARSSLYHVRKFLRQYNNCVSGISHEYRSTLWSKFDQVLKEAGVIDREDGEDTEAAHIVTEKDEPSAEIGISYADSCDSGENECTEGQFSFWGNLGDRQLNFDRP